MTRSALVIIMVVLPIISEEFYPIDKLCERQGMQCYLPINNVLEKWQNNSTNTEYLLGLQDVRDGTWMVVMRIAKNVGPARGMEVSVDGNLLFGCETTDGIKLHIAQGNYVKTEMFNSYLRRTLFLCVFSFSATEGNTIKEIFKDRGDVSVIVKHADSYHESTVSSNELFDGIIRKGYETTCWKWLKFENFSHVSGESAIRPIITRKETDEERITCPRKNMQLAFKDGGSYTQSSKIDCILDNMYAKTHEWIYIKPQVVICLAKTCSLCGEVNGIDGQKPPKLKSSGVNCAQLICPSDAPALVAEGINATFAAPVCKKFDEGDFRWTLPSPSGSGDVFFTEAVCARTVACQDVQPLNIKCDSAASCSLINPWAQQVACSEDYKLAVRRAKITVWELVHYIECNVTSGVWTKTAQNLAGSPLESQEEIKCFAPAEAESMPVAVFTTSTTLSTTSTTTTAAESTTTTRPSTTTTTTISTTTQPAASSIPTESAPPTTRVMPASSTQLKSKKSDSTMIIALVAGFFVVLLIGVIGMSCLVRHRKKARKAGGAKNSTEKKDSSKSPSSTPVLVTAKLTPPASSQTPNTPPAVVSERKRDKQPVEKVQSRREKIADLPVVEKQKADLPERDSSSKQTPDPVQVQQPVDNEEKEDAEQKKNKVQEMLEKSVVSEKTE